MTDFWIYIRAINKHRCTKHMEVVINWSSLFLAPLPSFTSEPSLPEWRNFWRGHNRWPIRNAFQTTPPQDFQHQACPTCVGTSILLVVTSTEKPGYSEATDCGSVVQRKRTEALRSGRTTKVPCFDLVISPCLSKMAGQSTAHGWIPGPGTVRSQREHQRLSCYPRS